ncbi:MAG: tRNA (adenosine(37)-N6)-threonylcarbamoyltransferase complex ATPase subunit type 1 TsaE, partial [Acidimicrobiia bacterium]|nr:tRNA (adenosine(37)-N6)-threonylcarbamoyltransferase complex ATPase subunit type 1 TsaE [Acidimicrobiia bacterium]
MSRTDVTAPIEVASDGPDRTAELAAALADLVEVGDLLILTGDLGAGKTRFTQGLGLGFDVEQCITSPTFTLANRYQGRLLLHHLDVYRLDSVAETLDLDLPDLLESGVTVIEWGDKISEVLPPDHLVVALRYPEPVDEHLDTDRIIEFTAHGKSWSD